MFKIKFKSRDISCNGMQNINLHDKRLICEMSTTDSKCKDNIDDYAQNFDDVTDDDADDNITGPITISNFHENNNTSIEDIAVNFDDLDDLDDAG